MKTNNNFLVLLLLVAGFWSCDDFDDLNENPTSSTVADPASLVSTVQIRHSGEREVTWRSTFAYHMAIMQMVTGGEADRGQIYINTPFYFEYLWEASYKNLNDLEIVIDQTSGDEAMVNYLAMAKILKVMIFAQLTDSYGDVPYFEASKGYSEGIIKPAYDTQQDIYNDFFVQLDTAVSLLNVEKPIQGDLIFDGDVNKWAKFANSLRLRYALRLVNVDEAKSQQEALLALDGGVMDDYTDAAYVTHAEFDYASVGAQEIRGNAFSQVQHFTTQYTLACKTYVDYMKDTVDGNDVVRDPRLRSMFGIYGEANFESTPEKSKSTTESSIEVTDEYLASEGILRAFPPGYQWYNNTDDYGLSHGTLIVQKGGQDIVMSKRFKCLQINKELTALDMPAMYMSYAEVELYKAEMAARGWGGNGVISAQAHFSEAVLASAAELVNVMGARPIAGDIQNYISTIWPTSGVVNELEVISLQQYMVNFYNPTEAYANWRRTGYPLLKPADHALTDPLLNGLIPRRMPYPSTEINFNAENVAQHLSEGMNDWGAPVWWDGSRDRGVLLD
ncbi:MAG: SusD/RagB family nutrient-binding outer membrane lipoprotein [Reichenbachiella sp.]|uniref:SusD/RagB family nutrient-binding outer membrane lipoprotein n=1 Tax=Reichenbachiella sp. TaxID=2184521 RepID=UPI003297386E